MASESERGRFVWYELMTTDPGGAKGFYTDVIGWGTQDWQGGPMPYTMWTVGDRPIGGVMELPDDAKKAGARPHWLPYVATPDVDATAAEAKKLGGEVIVQPRDIPNMGRFAILSDPQGAMFAIYQAAEKPPEGAELPGVGEFSWHELLTTDYKAAFEFYSKLFGWEKQQEMDIGPGGVYLMYGQNGQMYGGMFNKTADMPFPPNWTLYTRVADLDKAVERARKDGANIMIDRMEVPGGDLIAQGMDPQGAVFALHEKRS